MQNFTISIAGINVGIQYRYDLQRRFFYSHLTRATPDFTVSATDEELERERQLTGQDDLAVERICIYRRIAQRLPEYNAFVFHAAILCIDGKAFAFTAASGTGKTTHMQLLLSRFGERACVLNGDKPVLRLSGDGVLACGTPWKGKEGLGSRLIAPLCGICFVERALENQIVSLSGSDAAARFLKQIYLPQEVQTLRKTLALADRVLSTVPLYCLYCNTDPSAAQLSGSVLLQGAERMQRNVAPTPAI